MASEKGERIQHLSVFRQLLNVNQEIYSWIYNETGELLDTDSSQLNPMVLFQRSGSLDYALAYFREQSAPLLLGTEYGILWGAAKEDCGNSFLIHVIGPVLSGTLTAKAVEEIAYRNIENIETRKGFIALYERLPVVPTTLLKEFLLMMNYCVRDEKRHASEIQMQSSNITPHPDTEAPKQDRYQTYMVEKALLYCVREGDLNYKKSLERAGAVSIGIRVTTKNPISQAIISVTGFVTLCTRAAIEGGLSPDTAYSVGDSYIQAVMGCKSITEVGALSMLMYEDFIQRVHQERVNNNHSRTIRNCVEYIEQHPEEDLSIQMLAERFGYTDYYLSRKFRQEVGESINNYINYVRIERAKLLLETTVQSVSDIALTLHFCSSNYFSDTFRSIVGQSPIKYRRQKQGK